MRNLNAILTKLLEAAAGVIATPDREPWEYGWSSDSYRRSPAAALSGSNGPVSFTREALAVWETAAELLWRDKGVGSRWSAEERWGLLASLTVAASEISNETREEYLASALRKFTSCRPAFVSQLIANVSWSGEPLQIGNVLLGTADDRLLARAQTVAADRCVTEPNSWAKWLEHRVGPRATVLGATPVAACCWTTGQSELAIIEAERRIREVLDLPLLFEQDLAGHDIHRRGDVNRPGIRGLTLDRGAVQKGLGGQALSLELASFPLVRTEVFNQSIEPVQWYSAEPLPIRTLLDNLDLRTAVERALMGTPIAARLRVAARWFAEAHYTSARDDAALALGVCLDALIGSKQPIPGSAMGDRIALLTREPLERRAARQAYMHFYRIRSSVAHGGRSRKVNDDEALKVAFGLANTVARRLLDFEDAFNPRSDDEVDETFQDLHLGIKTWPS